MRKDLRGRKNRINQHRISVKDIPSKDQALRYFQRNNKPNIPESLQIRRPRHSQFKDG